jgi:Contractile injection system tape measure protein
MTRPNRHRIQRQIVELAVGAVAEAPDAQQQLAHPFWDRAVPELEEVFDRAAGPDELLRLERLEIDLGTIGGGDWPAEFKKKLIAELARSLAQFTAVSDADDEDGHGGPRSREPWRQFLFFLAHGRLPWWATAPIRRWSDVLTTGSDSEWNALRETVASDPRVRSRLVYSVDDEFLERGIGRWSGVLDAARVLEQLTPAHLGADPQRRWRRGFWMVVLDWVATDKSRSPHDGPQLLRDLTMLRAMYESDTAPSSHPQLASERSGHEGRSRPSASDLPEPWRGWWLSQHNTALFERAATEPPAAAGGAKGRAPREVPPRSRASEKTRRAAEDEAIYLAGAGVILVHPFLEQLFRERGLLSGKAFCGLDARDRAVQMIGLIAFGRMDVPEHELVLAKVLCGAAIEEPLEPVPLEDDDVAACDALLRAVLGHWTALRSSSPGWLREQFFLREGKLEEVDSGCRLTIERRAQDVLLARLPWGFGVVGLPWLTDRIYVHWLE